MRVPGSVLGLALAVGLAGCSGSDAGPSPRPSPSASASPSALILPVSALATVKPYTYRVIGGSNGAVPPEIERLSQFFDGYVGRLIIRDGQQVGTVQLLRTKPGVLGRGVSGQAVLKAFLTGFSHATSFSQKRVAGRDVLVATSVPNSRGSVAGWIDGRDLILLLTAPSLSPTAFAAAYIRAS